MKLVHDAGAIADVKIVPEDSVDTVHAMIGSLLDKVKKAEVDELVSVPARNLFRIIVHIFRLENESGKSGDPGDELRQARRIRETAVSIVDLVDGDSGELSPTDHDLFVHRAVAQINRLVRGLPIPQVGEPWPGGDAA